MSVPLSELLAARLPGVEGSRRIIELGTSSFSNLLEPIFVLTVLVLHIPHEGLEFIKLRVSVHILLFHVLDPLFIGLHLLLQI